MHQSYFALEAHSDVTRFEIEDGIVRGAVAQLLAQPSTIERVTVHIPRERSIDVGLPTATSGPQPALCITAEAENDAHIDLAPLIADVGIVADSWQVTTSTLAASDREWVGNVAPGVALRVAVSAAPGIDAANFRTWLTDALHRCADRCTDLQALRVTLPLHREPPSVIATISFETEGALDASLDASALEPFIGSEMIDIRSAQITAISEHLITPNPNTWT